MHEQLPQTLTLRTALTQLSLTSTIDDCSGPATALKCWTALRCLGLHLYATHASFHHNADLGAALVRIFFFCLTSQR